ncbi:MAG: hypothetical protein IKI95_02715 [Clostridia bacterium]|nr:hypothetical protein [Clostridia bacterium]
MLYQQGTQRIEIIVRKEGGGGSSAGVKETPTEDVGGKQTTWRTSVFGSENPKRIRRVIKTNTTHAVAVSKQVLDLGIEYWVSGLGYKNGDQALQDMTARKVERVKDVANVASSIAMGAVYGSWGGPIGSVLGMAFGAISTGVSTASKYAGRERDYNYKIFKEQNAIEYNRARAGINLTNGRLR